MATNIEKNSFLYGELNTQVKKNVYSGGTTPTADVIVDNSSNKIFVNAKIDVEQIELQVAEVEKLFELFLKDKELIQLDITELKTDVNDLSEKDKEIDTKIETLSDEVFSSMKNLKTELETKIDSLGLTVVDGMLCAVFEGE